MIQKEYSTLNKMVVLLQRGNLCNFVKVAFHRANSSPTMGGALLQLCCIINDRKPSLMYNKQVNHWLKWDKFFVEETHYKNGNILKG